MSNTTSTARRLAAAASSAGALWLASSAHAQCCVPDAEIAGTPDPAKITACIQSNKDNLKGAYPAIKRARTDLLCPMRAKAISAAFRIEYGRQLVPVLRPLIKDPEDNIALNAVRIAGELATADAADLLSEALTDKRPAVRMMAAEGYERTFTAMTASPAMVGTQAMALFNTLERAVGTESDAHVLNGLAAAFDAAMHVPDATVPGLRVKSMEMATKAFAARAQKSGADATAEAALARISNALRTSLTQVGEPQAPDATLKEIGGFTGDVLAYALRRVQQGNLGVEERDNLSLLVKQAEQVYFFVHKTLAGAAGGAPLQLHLSELIAEGKDNQYRSDVLQLIGKSGVLTQPPFGFPEDRFNKK